MVRDHLPEAQQGQARVYNRGAQLIMFQPGDLVMVWQGPYEVVDKVGDVNYRVRQPGRRKPTQLYHINLLKQWRSGPSPPVLAPLVLAARRDIPVVRVGDDLSPAQKS